MEQPAPPPDGSTELLRVRAQLSRVHSEPKLPPPARRNAVREQMNAARTLQQNLWRDKAQLRTQETLLLVQLFGGTQPAAPSQPSPGSAARLPVVSAASEREGQTPSLWEVTRTPLATTDLRYLRSPCLCLCLALHSAVSTRILAVALGLSLPASPPRALNASRRDRPLFAEPSPSSLGRREGLQSTQYQKSHRCGKEAA